MRWRALPISNFMTPDPVRVRSVAPQHTEHWHSLNLNGYAGGPFADRTGGLITFLVDRPDQAEEAVTNDPFVREGFVERSWLKQWEPGGP